MLGLHPEMLKPLFCRVVRVPAAKRGGWPTKINFILFLGPALALFRCTFGWRYHDAR